MNKKLKIINIVIWAIVAIFLTSILVYGVSTGVGNGGSFFSINLGNSATTIQKEESISLDKCESITLDFSSDDIIILSTNDENLKVVQKSSVKLNEQEKFSFSKKDNAVEITNGEVKKIFNIFSFGSLGNKIELSIPKKYNKNLIVKTSSGNIELKDELVLDKVNFSQSSGDFKGKANITANEASFHANSGNIKLETLITKSYKMDTSSGDIVIKSLSGSGQAEASSGNIKIDYKEIGDQLKAHTSSGDIKLTIPQNISFEFYGECNSGDIDTDFDVSYKSKKKHEATAKVGNGPYKNINLSASSGDIKVYQK